MNGMLEQAIQPVLVSMAPLLVVAGAVLFLLKLLSVALKGGRRTKGANWRRDMRDPKLQADAVSRVDFVRTPLMNKGEFRVFSILERSLSQSARGFRLMAQTNLGEFLKPDPKTPDALKSEAFASINSKRVDFLVIDTSGRAALAVEVQGSGHYLGQTAFMRDAVKKEALRRAGVPLLEVTPDMQPEEIISQMKRMLGLTTDARRIA